MRNLPPRRFYFALTALLMVLAVGGCSRSGPSYGEVGGSVEVVYGGVPVPDVLVKFYPAPDSKKDGPTAEGFTDSNGQFDLSTWRTERTGAIAGLHRVTFKQVQTQRADPPTNTSASKNNVMSKLPPEVRERMEKAKRAKVSKTPAQSAVKIPQEFADPFSTPFMNVEVKPGVQYLKFDLKEKTWKSELLE